MFIIRISSIITLKLVERALFATLKDFYNRNHKIYNEFPVHGMHY